MKNVYILLCLLLAGYFSVVETTEGTCIWYGVCGYNPNYPSPAFPVKDDNHCLNCAYSGKPKPLNNQTATRILYDVCPHFRDEFGENPEVCCTPTQIEVLQLGYLQAEAI